MRKAFIMFSVLYNGALASVNLALGNYKYAAIAAVCSIISAWCYNKTKSL